GRERPLLICGRGDRLRGNDCSLHAAQVAQRVDRDAAQSLRNIETFAAAVMHSGGKHDVAWFERTVESSCETATEDEARVVFAEKVAGALADSRRARDDRCAGEASAKIAAPMWSAQCARGDAQLALERHQDENCRRLLPSAVGRRFAGLELPLAPFPD